MNSRHHRKRLTARAWLAHVLLLLCWTFSSHGMVPALCMAVAVYDGEHAVKVRSTQDGELTVVLCHETAGQPHQHDVLCDLVTAFAVPSLVGDPDHVLCFKSVHDASRLERGVALNLAASCAPMLSSSAAVAWPPVPFSECRRLLEIPAWSPGLALKAGRMIMLC